MAGKKQNSHIHAFGFQITDMIVAELVRSYILHMPVDAAKEQLNRIFGVDNESEQRRQINADELAVLIENAKATAGIEAMEWKEQKGERLLNATIEFLRDDFLPALDSWKYVASMPEKMVETLEKCWLAVSEEVL